MACFYSVDGDTSLRDKPRFNLNMQQINHRGFAYFCHSERSEEFKERSFALLRMTLPFVILRRQTKNLKGQREKKESLNKGCVPNLDITNYLPVNRGSFIILTISC